MTLDLPTLHALAERFRQDLLGRGCSARYAAQQVATVIRAGLDPAGFLEAGSAVWTAASLADRRNRLAIFGGWLAQQPEGASLAAPWRTLPRGLKAAKVKQDRAAFDAEEVKRLLDCAEIPAHRRAFYRCIATLGLRPAEASRIEPHHVVREGAGFVLRLPGASQKSGRPDPIHLEAWQAKEIIENLPLVRRSLSSFQTTFQRDLMKARIPIRQGNAVRRLYDLRSAFISILLREGVDLETVRQLARHRRIETTLLHYTRHREGHAGKVRAEVFKSMRARRVTA